jgi:hypothetical protein
MTSWPMPPCPSGKFLATANVTLTMPLLIPKFGTPLIALAMSGEGDQVMAVDS